MATCFCGHGEKVGLTSRGINRQGQRTVELLSKLRALQEVVKALDSLDVLDELIREGEEYEADWSSLVHSAPAPPPAEARALKKEWEAWGKRGMTLDAAMQKLAKPASGRKAFARVFTVVQDVEGRLGALSPGQARSEGEAIYSQLEPLTRGEIPDDIEPGSGMNLVVQAHLWLAATSADWRYRAT